ncbi:hypothetical protein K7432_005417 [Basidiobolus ranarum]|uniref:Uncharacterized protein n=1 Tax=Basidiobolus ranarum TaxID=34480 RepID=A0ABR2WWM8_9FUNG
MMKQFMTIGCLVSMIVFSQGTPVAQPDPQNNPFHIPRDLARVAIATLDDFIATPISNVLTGGNGFPWQQRPAATTPTSNRRRNNRNNRNNGGGSGPRIVFANGGQGGWNGDNGFNNFNGGGGW